MAMLGERVLAQLQISRGPNGTAVATSAKALDEPAVFVRLPLERLRDQGIVFRRGGWWFAAEMHAQRKYATDAETALPLPMRVSFQPPWVPFAKL
jgi:hypothetical protein